MSWQLQSTPASGSRYTHSSLRSPKVTPRPRLTPRVTGVVTRSAAAKVLTFFLSAHKFC
eukprot:m.37163 g.37163  ORF g.37163 m.37163 type:complete len:59 (+) comp32337_c0_seq2:1647-1823(+)